MPAFLQWLAKLPLSYTSSLNLCMWGCFYAHNHALFMFFYPSASITLSGPFILFIFFIPCFSFYFVFHPLSTADFCIVHPKWLVSIISFKKIICFTWRLITLQVLLFYKTSWYLSLPSYDVFSLFIYLALILYLLIMLHIFTHKVIAHLLFNLIFNNIAVVL